MNSEIMYVTYCSRKKLNESGLHPAGKLYLGKHIAKVQEIAKKDEVLFRILSGSPKYHLIKPDDLVEWYDHLLQFHEVEQKVKNVAAQLSGQKIQKIVFFMKIENDENIQPYKDAMEKVCLILGNAFELRKF